MRRHSKLKFTSNRLAQRKTATSSSAAARRSFPAWIDAGETTVTFSAARSAIPRVRDGLVLRRVGKQTERRVRRGGSQ